MTSDTDLERTRRFSLAEVKRLLAMVDPNADKLFAKARTVLGAERAARCLELARLAPLTGRWVPTSAVAQLVVGTMDVGADWWARPHEELDASRVWAQTGTPDALLEAGQRAHPHLGIGRVADADPAEPLSHRLGHSIDRVGGHERATDRGALLAGLDGHLADQLLDVEVELCGGRPRVGAGRGGPSPIPR